MNIHKHKGVTLIEMMLVIVIVSSIIYMFVGYMQQRALNIRMERTAQQMQLILNSGLAYYVNLNGWPTDIETDLQDKGYLAQGTIISPWGTTYAISSTIQVFSVTVSIPEYMSGRESIAQVIAGKLPLGIVDPATFNVTASVNLPGQSLNNAPAVNFAGLYHHGGCVPVPQCPVGPTGTMTPEVFFIPVSVSGLSDENQSNVYPISSFTAYASGSPSATPNVCAGSNKNSSNSTDCPGPGGSATSTNLYWRACLQVISEKGSSAGVGTNPANLWGQNVTLAAFTRCAISAEPSGSPSSVFSN